MHKYARLDTGLCHILYIRARWHMYASMSWVNIGPGNVLAPVSCQAITCTNTDLLPI